MVCPQVLLLGRAVHARGDGSDVVRRLVDGPGTRSVVGVPDSRLRPPGTTPPLADGVSRCAVFSPTAVPAGLPGRRAFGDEDRRCGQDSGRRELQVHLGRAAAAQPPIALERDHRLELHLVRGAKPPPFLWCLRSGFSCCRRAGITRGDFVRVGKEEALFTNHYVLCRARFTCRDSSARRGQRRGPRAASCRWCCAPRRRSAAH